MKTKHHRHPVLIPELDLEITDKAEHLYEDLINKEGFSDEQALSMAMAEIGEHDGDIDLDIDEEELIEHAPEPIHLDALQSERPPTQKIRNVD